MNKMIVEVIFNNDENGKMFGPHQGKGPSGVRTDWWVHTRTSGSCVGDELHIQVAH